MTKKQRIINAFKNLDFETLEVLLDDEKPYMDVPKKTFLEALKSGVRSSKGLLSYETIEEGICNSCHKGCKAYRLAAKNQPSLDLFFEGTDENVTDIYLCNDIKFDGYENEEDHPRIYFDFYEEEKVTFSPSLEYLLNTQDIDQAIEEYCGLEEKGLVSIEDILYWFNQYKHIENQINERDDSFERKKYKPYVAIEILFLQVSEVINNYKKNNLAKRLLKSYYELDVNNEKSIIKWLLENRRNYFYPLKQTPNWKNTGILILDTEPNLVVDCSDFLDSFLYYDIFDHHYSEMMTKYKPTKEHFEQHPNGIDLSLEAFIKLHKAHLDLF